MTKKQALLIIDVQVGQLEGPKPAHRAKEVLDNIQTLQARAQQKDVPVIFVQHDAGPGELFEVGTATWQIHPQIAPRAGEPVIHKQAADAFYETQLQQTLEQQGIEELVIVGCKTQFCIDTTCRRATTLGYDAVLVGDAHTTWDTDILAAETIIAYHNDILDDFGNDDHVVLTKSTKEITF